MFNMTALTDANTAIALDAAATVTTLSYALYATNASNATTLPDVFNASADLPHPT